MQALELRVPPVAQVLVVGAAMWAGAGVFPGFAVGIALPVWVTAGLVVLGVAVALAGVWQFRQARTTVDPRFPDKSSQLVVEGVYRLSRNPMYLGFVLILLGWAAMLMNYLSFGWLAVFVAYINRFQITPEERFMAQKFGPAFADYAARVRRWL